MTLGATTATLDDDLFSAGFDEGLTGDSTTDKTAEELAAEQAAADQVAADQAAADQAAAEQAAADQAAVVQKPAEVDIPKLIAEAVAATAATKPAEQAPAVVVEPDQAPALTAEEIAAEEQYRKDWPEHAAREDRLKTEISDLKQMLDKAISTINGQIAPVIEDAYITAEQRHIDTIAKAHADWNEIVPDVVEWVKVQPGFMQPQYMKTLNEGSAKDVVDLFNMYKKDKGIVADSGKAEAAAAAAAQVAAENAAKLKRMITPGAVRTSVTAEDDPEDFDGAFDAAAKKIAA